jgi:hypothetical protein
VYKRLVAGREPGESASIRDSLSSLLLDSTPDPLPPPHIPAASAGIERRRRMS